MHDEHPVDPAEHQRGSDSPKPGKLAGWNAPLQAGPLGGNDPERPRCPFFWLSQLILADATLTKFKVAAGLPLRALKSRTLDWSGYASSIIPTLNICRHFHIGD
jgi:hypothetical protein